MRSSSSSCGPNRSGSLEDEAVNGARTEIAIVKPECRLGTHSDSLSHFTSTSQIPGFFPQRFLQVCLLLFSLPVHRLIHVIDVVAVGSFL